MGSMGSKPQVVEIPVYQAADRNTSVTAAIAQDISAENQAALSTQTQLRKRTGGIMSTYNRFASETGGKQKLGQ